MAFENRGALMADYDAMDHDIGFGRWRVSDMVAVCADARASLPLLAFSPS
jgi:hypothetical protein